MRFVERRFLWAAIAAGACLLALTPTFSAARAADGKTYIMKIGLATINDTQDQWCKWFVSSVEKDSNNQVKGHCYPVSQLGSIPREIEGVQFGEIQGYIGPPEFLVGVDARYQALSAPGLVDNIEQAVRVAGDPQLQKVMFSIGTNKGLKGVALFIEQPSSVIARKPIRRLSDFKGLKLRVLAAAMQEDMISKLGATPITMTLGDVLPAIQEGTIDGALAGVNIYSTMHYWDAAKYVTETGQPFIFSMAFLSKKWFDSLPNRMQTILTKDAAEAAVKVDPWGIAFYQKERQAWLQHGGKFIEFSTREHAQMIKMLADVGPAVAKGKPELRHAFDVFAAAAKRAK